MHPRMPSHIALAHELIIYLFFHFELKQKRTQKNMIYREAHSTHSSGGCLNACLRPACRALLHIENYERS